MVGALSTPRHPEDGVGRVQVFRQPVYLRVICAAAMASLATVLAVGGVQEDGWLRGLCLIGAALVVLAATREWQLRVEVADGVTLVNRLTTTHIPWAEVERFGYDGALWVRRRDMRQHYAAAFSFVPGSLPSASTRGRDTAVKLENIRKKRRRKGGGVDR